MTEETALALLKAMVAAEQSPTIDDDTLLLLIRPYAVTDEDGQVPPPLSEWDEVVGMYLYVPTYPDSRRWLHQCAYDAWGMKAAKASGMVSFTADGHSFHNSDLFDHCERMQAKYAKSRLPKGGAWSVSVAYPLGTVTNAD